MPLSDEDKRRIREEEAFRIQVRQELENGATASIKTLIFWAVLVAAAVLLFVVVRTR